MSPAARAHYHAVLWPAACAACEWDPKDRDQRRKVTRDCMAAVRGPEIDSTADLRCGPDEITALFTYLTHLADSASLDKAAAWLSCCDDYRTFNRARQADWHETALYGQRPNKLDRNRFAGAKTAAGHVLDRLDRDKVAKRLLTFQSRHQKKMREDRKSGLPIPAAATPPKPTPQPRPKETVDAPFDPFYSPPRQRFNGEDSRSTYEIWIDDTQAPEARLLKFDSWLRKLLTEKLTWPEDEIRRTRQIEQCRVLVERLVIELRNRGWLFDGRRLAEHLQAAVNDVAAAQREGRVREMYAFFRVVMDRYARVRAEDLHRQAMLAGCHISRIVSGLRPGMTELVGQRADETLRAKVAARRAAEKSAKEDPAQARLF